MYAKDNTFSVLFDSSLHVITFLVSAGPSPALVDAVIAQLY